MSIQYSARGFIFGKEDKAETDRIFCIFTEEFGKLKVFGKAIRKIKSKIKSGIDIFSLSEIEFVQGKTKKTLTDATFINNFKRIKTSPKRFEIANKISDATDNLVREQEREERIFNLLKDSFNILNSDYLEKKNCDLVYYYYAWNLFSALGFKPEINKCACCFSNLNPNDIYFSYKDGGIICKKCFDPNKNAKKISPEVVKILRLILNDDWATISKLKIDLEIIKMLQDISEKYYFYLLDK